MPNLTNEIAAEIQQTATTNAQEMAEAIGRAFDLEDTTCSVNEATPLGSGPEAIIPPGPGLALLLKVEGEACLLGISESTGILPEWCPKPDPTGESKLKTLAQELSMLILPESLFSDSFTAKWVDDLPAAMTRGGVDAEGSLLPIGIGSTTATATAYLVWPVAKPDEVFVDSSQASEEPAAAPEAAAAPAAPTPPPSPKPVQKHLRSSVNYEDLPSYTKSLLKIKVPVSVTLAEKRQPISQILELGPGSIIQFEKSCEEFLDLDVGVQRVAQGEVIKVGDKFGLRITNMVLPEERFHAIRIADVQ
jgi:flagellar motor switch/type III secretory pathway protein FliN